MYSDILRMKMQGVVLIEIFILLKFCMIDQGSCSSCHSGRSVRSSLLIHDKQNIVKLLHSNVDHEEIIVSSELGVTDDLSSFIMDNQVGVMENKNLGKLNTTSMASTSFIVIELRDLKQVEDILKQLLELYQTETTGPGATFRGKVFIICQCHEHNLWKSLKNFTSYVEIRQQVFVLAISKSCESMEVEISVWEFYSIKSEPIVRKIFSGNSRGSIPLPLATAVSRRSNLKNAVIRGISPMDINEERLVKMQYQNGQLAFVSGFVVSVLRDLQMCLNFRVKAVEAEDYILLGPNETLLGMGKQIVDGEADIGVSLAYFATYRARHLTYLHSISNVRVMAFFRKPDTGNSMKNFMKPFGTNLWLALLGMTILITVSIMIHRVLSRLSGSPLFAKDYWFYNEVIIWIFGILSQQGWHTSPSTISIQIIFYFGFILGVVLFSAYCASIVSALTSTSNAVSSIQDLISLDYFILVDTNTGLRRLLESSCEQSPVKLKLAKLLKNTNETEAKLIRLVLDGNHAILLTLDSFYTNARKELSKDIPGQQVDKYLCDHMGAVPLTNIVIKSGMFVPKGSPFKDFFNNKILMIMERGLNTRYMNKLIEDTNPACSQNSVSFRKELEFSELKTPFLILIVGSLLALFGLAAEFLRFRCQQRWYYSQKVSQENINLFFLF